jgi:effector-binding domain-containing protein
MFLDFFLRKPALLPSSGEQPNQLGPLEKAKRVQEHASVARNHYRHSHLHTSLIEVYTSLLRAVINTSLTVIIQVCEVYVS